MAKGPVDEAFLAIQELIDYCKAIDDEVASDGDFWDTWQSDEFSELIVKAERALRSIAEGYDAESIG